MEEEEEEEESPYTVEFPFHCSLDRTGLHGIIPSTDSRECPEHVEIWFQPRALGKPLPFTVLAFLSVSFLNTL